MTDKRKQKTTDTESEVIAPAKRPRQRKPSGKFGIFWEGEIPWRLIGQILLAFIGILGTLLTVLAQLLGWAR